MQGNEYVKAEMLAGDWYQPQGIRGTGYALFNE